MIEILTWTSIFTGGILVLLFLVSLLGGLDLDIDFDTDIEGGGIGLLKGSLTFISVASWVMKVLLVTNKHPGMVIFVGLFSGLLAFGLLSYVYKILRRQDENVNWEMSDVLFANGEVYLRIPQGGSGIVNVVVKGANREVKAKAKDNKEISTGSKVIVVDTNGEFAIVEKSN